MDKVHIYPTVEQVIAHIEKNEREATLTALEYEAGSWWVQIRKDSIITRPAVHKSLVEAYAIALAHFEEAR